MNNQVFVNDYSEKLNISANKPYQADQGHLRLDALVTRVGVLRYFDPVTNDWINVLRHPDEVFNPDSLATFAGIPLTIDHPTKNGIAIQVTPKNYKQYGVGTVGDEIEVVNPYVKISGLNIQTEDAFNAIQKGNKQLSPGYAINRVKESGVFDGINYTHRQYGVPIEGDSREIIRYNHTAIMSPGNRGRSGEYVKLLMIDSEEENEESIIKMPVLYHCPEYNFDSDKNKIFDMKSSVNSTVETKRKIMKQISIQLKPNLTSTFAVDADQMVSIPMSDFQMIADAVNAISGMMAQYNVATPAEVPPAVQSGMAEMDSLKASLTASEAAKTALESEVEKLTEKVNAFDSVIDSAISERVLLVKEAETIIGDCAKKTPQEIKLAVIHKWDSNQKFEGDSAAIAIDAVYPIALRSLKASEKTIEKNAQIVADSTEKGDKTLTTDRQTAIKKNFKKSRNLGLQMAAKAD